MVSADTNNTSAAPESSSGAAALAYYLSCRKKKKKKKLGQAQGGCAVTSKNVNKCPGPVYFKSLTRRVLKLQAATPFLIPFNMFANSSWEDNYFIISCVWW